MPPEQEIRQQDLEEAVKRFLMLKYYRADMNAAIMDELFQMCPHRRALLWLVDEMVKKVGIWDGPVEMRAVLCQRFDPRDGVDAWSNKLTSRAEEQHLERHKQLKEAEGYIAEDLSFQRLLGAAAERKKLT